MLPRNASANIIIAQPMTAPITMYFVFEGGLELGGSGGGWAVSLML